MSLDIPIPIDDIDTSAESIPSKTAYINFDAGRIIGYVDGLSAMRQFVKKTLMTPRFRCLIYSSGCGAEVDTLISENRDEDFFESEAQRMVEEALLCDARVSEVYDFEFASDGDSRTISFTVDTIYGTISEEVVISV